MSIPDLLRACYRIRDVVLQQILAPNSAMVVRAPGIAPEVIVDLKNPQISRQVQLCPANSDPDEIFGDRFPLFSERSWDSASPNFRSGTF